MGERKNWADRLLPLKPGRYSLCMLKCAILLRMAYSYQYDLSCDHISRHVLRLSFFSRKIVGSDFTTCI